MRKLLSMALAFAFAASAVPAFASVQNVKVYGNLDNTYLYRQHMDFKGQQNQSNFFTQTRIGVDADLTDNVSVTFGLINERLWASDNTASSSDVDLYLAYATIREMLYSPLTVIVGRQQWGYGNGFIFNSTGANNVAPTDSGLQNIADDFTYQTALDAVRFILDYNPLTIEGFYALSSQGSAPSMTNNASLSDDVEVIGLNLGYALGDDMDSLVEAYGFNQIDGSSALHSNDDTLYVTGLRGSTNPVEGLNLQLEFAKQHGTSGLLKDKRQAYGVQGIVNYQLPVMEEWNPVLNYTLTKVSGDDNPLGGKNEAWTPFFEAQGFGTIYNQLFDLTNLTIHSASLETTPVEDVTAKLSYSALFTTKKGGSISIQNPYASGAQTLGQNTGANGKSEIGHEVDVDLSYAYTEDVKIGANLGYFLPGDRFTDINDTSAKQAIVSVGVAF